MEGKVGPEKCGGWMGAKRRRLVERVCVSFMLAVRCLLAMPSIHLVVA